MDKIDELIYKNLRENFNKLVTHILGENYYNMAMDIYQSDIECYNDIKRKYDYLKSDVKLYKTISIVLAVICITLILIK